MKNFEAMRKIPGNRTEDVERPFLLIYRNSLQQSMSILKDSFIFSPMIRVFVPKPNSTDKLSGKGKNKG